MFGGRCVWGLTLLMRAHTLASISRQSAATVRPLVLQRNAESTSQRHSFVAGKAAGRGAAGREKKKTKELERYRCCATCTRHSFSGVIQIRAFVNWNEPRGRSLHQNIERTEQHRILSVRHTSAKHTRQKSHARAKRRKHPHLRTNPRSHKNSRLHTQTFNDTDGNAGNNEQIFVQGSYEYHHYGQVHK